jgi:hypothetical protein
MYGLECLGLYYGSYRGNVVDNTGFSEGGAVQAVTGGQSEMDKIGLLKVRVPSIGDTPDTPPRVAYPKVPLAGGGYGVKNIPPKGSFVWVEFEHGRLDAPIWSGGWWAKGEMPSELESVDAFGWVTPGGHKLLLVDDDGGQKVRLEHSNGAYLEWDFQGNVILTNFETAPGSTTIVLGEGASEAAILGDTLKGLMDELIDAITQLTVISPAGTTSPPVNVAAFTAIKARLQTMLSLRVKVK